MRVSLALAVTALALSAAPAGASVVERYAELSYPDPNDPLRPQDDIPRPTGRYLLAYTAAPGERNTLVLRFDRDGVTITDAGNQLEAKG